MNIAATGCWVLAVLLGFLFFNSSEPPVWSLVVVAIVLVGLALPVSKALTTANRSKRTFPADAVAGRRLAAEARHAAVRAMGLSITTAIILAILTGIFANEGAVQKTFLDPKFMISSSLDVVKALGINVMIAVSAEILALLFGLILAIGRLLPGPGWAPLRWLSIIYIDVFRGIPSVVLIYLICFGLPLTGFPLFQGIPLEVLTIGALALTYAAYNAELYRSGIESINPGQTAAALSMGLTYPDVFRFVLLPQVLRNIAPPMLSQFIGLQKDTALVIVVGVVDAFSQAKIYAANDFNLSAVTVVCIVFVLITIPQTRIVDYLINRTERRRGA